MIAYACPGCKKRYKVPDDCAGATTTCPNCKIQLMVPTPRPPSQLVPLQQEVDEDLPEVKPMAKPRPQPLQATVVLCPFCESEISPTAKKCRYCGETVDLVLRSMEDSRRSDGVVNQQQVVIHGGRGDDFPHAMHAIITLFACGLWFPVWIIHYISWSSSRSSGRIERYDNRR
jgi:hypothetical protein